MLYDYYYHEMYEPIEDINIKDENSEIENHITENNEKTCDIINSECIWIK